MDSDAIDAAWTKQNLLSLDSGGVRGYWSLLALRKLMQYIAAEEKRLGEDEEVLHSFYPLQWPQDGLRVISNDEKLRRVSPEQRFLPCHYFDCICGSGNGGFIAIMLGRLRMTVYDCIDEYKTLCGDVFGRPRFSSTLKFGLGNRPKYEAARLEETFKGIIARHDQYLSGLSGSASTFASGRGLCKTLIPTSRTQLDGRHMTPYMIRSYDHEQNEPRSTESARRKSSSYGTHIAHSSSQDLDNRGYKRNQGISNYGKADQFQIWEAARAATAVPFYFEPLKATIPGSRDYVLFGSGSSTNPALTAVEELESLYGRNSLRLVLSVGTAENIAEDRNMKPFKRFSSPQILDFASRDQSEIGDRAMKHKMQNAIESSYYRFNDTERLNIDSDEWEPKANIFNKTSGYLTTASIEEAFAGWASSVETSADLEKCAIALVECRRVRSFNINKWERFATGVRFDCQVPGCDVTNLLSSTELHEHLKRVHPKLPSIPDQESLSSRFRTSQSDKTALTDTFTKPTSPDSKGTGVGQQKPSLKQQGDAVRQDDVVGSLTAALSRNSIHSSKSEAPPYSTAEHDFARDPQSFYNTMHDLQNQIFEIGRDCIGHIVWEDAGHSLALPVGSCDSSGSVSELLQVLNPLLERNSKLLQAVLEGLHLLNSVKFCKPVYNIIVQDASRCDVLRVVPIDSSTLFTLHKLVEEASSKCTPSHWNSFQQVLSDVDETVRLILDHLHLSTLSQFNVLRLGHRELLYVCQSLSSTASILFIGLVSFVRSHLAVFDEASMHPTHLKIETVGNLLFMRPKRLACLDACIQHPIWAFETRSSDDPDSRHSESRDRFAVSILLADLADLWGPIKFKYCENETEDVAEITIRGGTIRKSKPSISGSCLLNETECHWHSWLETSPRLEEHGNLSTTGRLLIGASQNTHQMPKKSLLAPETCNSKSYALKFQEFELGTKFPSWRLDTKSEQVSAGKYVNLTYGQTWKFDAGWTLKQVIIEDWLENVSRNERHRPRPLYLDYMVVIETSGCSGHSRRLSLWQLIASSAVDGYVSGLLEDRQSRKDFQTLKGYGLSTPFADIWRERLSGRQKSLMRSIIHGLLENMRHTGVAEDGSLQTWDVTSPNRIAGRRIDPNWTSMVKDDTISASFAVITHRCFRFDSVPHADPQYHQGSVLFTKICITIHRPAQRVACGTKDISQWRVIQPEELSIVDDNRMRVIEEARLLSRPDLSSIEDRQSLRQPGIALSKIDFADTQRQRELKDSTRLTREVTHHNNFRGGQEISFEQNGRKDMFCTRSMDFKNGKGNRIGTLTLRFHGHKLRVNLGGLSENQPLPVGWDTYKNSRITRLSKKAKGKVREADDAAIEWVKRHFTTPLPWMIEPDADNEAFREYAVEHLRGGDVVEGQKLLTVHVH